MPDDLTAAEDWPHLAHESRAALFAKCQAAGVDMAGKWLSEAAGEAIDKLRAELAAARAVVDSLAERVQKQSDLLSRRAEVPDIKGVKSTGISMVFPPEE